MKTIKDIGIKDKTILMRADYNVPMKSGEITSDLRIRASLPTLEYLRAHEAKKIILLSHLGRPKGVDPAFSLEPVAHTLDDLIGHVSFVPDVSGPAVTAAVDNMKPGDILLLENLRFYPGEKSNDASFIQPIIDATHPDFYVQDAFAVLHRTHASTDAVKSFLPIYAGLLVDHEVENLRTVLDHPARPLLFIIGGAKVEDKAPLIDKFSELADKVFVGGKIATDGYTHPSPKVYIAEDFDEDGTGAQLDTGPISTAKLASLITDADTIVWNGLLGYAEDPAFATSSTIAAELIGEKSTATTIICGGDTTGFVESLLLDHPSLSYSLLSTGGGASLEFLLGHPLPGLLAIN